MPQGAREGGAAYIEDVRTDICSSATARLGLLSCSTTYIHVSVLRCSNMLHPCNDAISALPPSMVVVCRKEQGRRCGEYFK